MPELTAVAVDELFQAEIMLLPGAKMSRQLPQLENEERASVEVVEPTVIAFGAEAGEDWQASAFSLPAATTKLIPSLIALCTPY